MCCSPTNPPAISMPRPGRASWTCSSASTPRCRPRWSWSRTIARSPSAATAKSASRLAASCRRRRRRELRRMMASLRFALRNLLRDLKSGELAILMLALLVAVGSLTAVGFFTSRVGRAVEQQAGEVLAADLRLESPRAIDESYDAAARQAGLRVARILTMPSVVFHGEESSLVALRAVGEGYPLRRRLKVAGEPFGPSRAT